MNTFTVNSIDLSHLGKQIKIHLEKLDNTENNYSI